VSLTTHHTDGEHPLRSDGYTDRIHRSAIPGSCYVTWSSCVGSGTSYSHQFTAVLLNTTHRNICIGVRLEFSDLNASPSLCQRRLQPHLHHVGYGNDRANAQRSTPLANIYKVALPQTALLRHRITEVALLATKDALIMKNIIHIALWQSEAYTALTVLVAAAISVLKSARQASDKISPWTANGP
jgi:hypothetical protein